MFTINATAEQILSIPTNAPELLFPKDVEEAKKIHRKLASIWHPDKKQQQGSDVLAHINVLFETHQIRSGTSTPIQHEVRLESVSDKSYSLTFLKHHRFEIGDMYIGVSYVTYVIDSGFSDLAKLALDTFHFKYPNKEMEKEHQRWLPSVKTSFEMKDGRTAIVLHKPPGYFLLKDLHNFLNGDIDPKHVAWILSCVYNINCYLKIANITHNDISPFTLFVNPTDHSVILMGGWWYSGKVGSKPIAVPSRTRNVSNDFTTKSVDSALIRLVGKELLGARLMKEPPELQRWLRGLGGEDSFEEYKKWYDLLNKVYGPRKFIKLDIPQSIY